jgi:hypothetical protein
MHEAVFPGAGCFEWVAGGVSNVNALTSERLTDIGGKATFYSTLVEVRRWKMRVILDMI